MSGDTPRTETGGPAPLPRSGPQGLPRRPRSAPAAPPEDVAEPPGADDDAEDTLCPDTLARAMVAIRRGSTRARLAGPDDPVPPPAPTEP
ncbi:hypothetical protein F9278_37965 [Streptomyces phaeolivaceus]|uniref:Uncharacterized protein n=1 Tax=Streptomyces phaeolivaceus TaxID=2653200 RepID=A0A5P8KDY6_9ACTN|nr:hypothetical protein [Streptomyces phaeolivaceus]QFR01013.1 hypothetical protein F9278_37965 [Streptomyces phaeolivaceus]